MCSKEELGEGLLTLIWPACSHSCKMPTREVVVRSLSRLQTRAETASSEMVYSLLVTASVD